MPVFDDLQIYDARERWAVGLADAGLRLATAPARLWRAPRPHQPPRRILVLRLERIGDLLMTFGALASLRARLPHAEIDLCVASWNASLARAMSVADRVDVLDPPWLARDQPGTPWTRLRAHARGWRRNHYDLAINLEPDIRSNLLVWWSGALRRVGYFTGGGGALLTDQTAYNPGLHTHDNAMRLVGLAVPGQAYAPSLRPRLRLSGAARERARELLAPAAGAPCVGIHASGGRPVKQWHAGRFAEVATALGREYGATVVLTGAPSDTALVRAVEADIPDSVRVLNLCGRADVIDLAAVIERLAIFVTGDTGPMHLAAAVGTPVVALFGPSVPARYAPLSAGSRVVRVDLPCSPCNRIRLPPDRCRGRVPECLDGISVDAVLAAVRELLESGRTILGEE
jgi:lipopolysaccharide heptosyltransferase II